ncbi:MAG: hypothetical protein IH989_04070 [Planctomycetes bacterium]|nr:hypothetical protein [Planctomycetota bacterium]
MRKQSIEHIVKALNDASVRYLVAGGLAVVAHGHLRFTADIDLILDLDEDNAKRALAALKALGYRPRAPVEMEEFADARTRARWVREKKLAVFSLSSPQHPATEVDLFVESPLDFEAAYKASVEFDVARNVAARFLGMEDLILLKQQAGRSQDLADIEALRALKDAKHP